MDALANLGIDWKLLLAQAINFLVLLFILRRFAYKPMLDFLEKRSARIEQGLKYAEAAREKLAETEAQHKKIIVSARNEARVIVDAAEAFAKKRDAERLAETEAKTRFFLEEAQKKIEAEKRKMLLEVKQEIVEMVVATAEKVVREKMDNEKDKKLIADMMQ